MNNFDYFRELFDAGNISNEAYCYLKTGKVSSENIESIIQEKKISITISTHNRKDLLIRLLDSIIEQNYNNYEIIIIDDTSTDNTEEEIKRYIDKYSEKRILYFRNEINLGVTKSKKRGYELCSGDIIIFSDDDDYYIDPEYFAKVNRIYSEHEDCIMTTASTLYHYERNDTYKYFKMNFTTPLSNDEYLNGFVTKYRKPGSMFTLTLNAMKMREIEYEKLKCFNDMSLYLYASLSEGNVYPIVEAVGVYSVQVVSMTSGVSASYTIENLNAKLDIALKAVSRNIIRKENYSKWVYAQSLPTLMNFYNGKIKQKGDLYRVNKWVLNNLEYPNNIKAIMHGFISRLKRHIKNIL